MQELKSIQLKKNKIIRTVAHTALLMSILTLGSKFLGFVREMVMANYFGTSYVVDAYVMAQTIPTILFGGIFVAVAVAYIPLLSTRIEKEGQKSGNVFTSNVINILLLISIVSSLIGIIFSEQLTAILANGFTGETAALTSFFLRITLCYILFTSISGILEAYLQYKHTFIPQIIIGYTQSILVIGVIIFSAYFNYYYLAYGLLLAYVIRLLLIFYVAKKHEFRYTLKNKATKEVLKQITILSMPIFIGNSANQINIFVDRYLASGLAEGSIAAMNYANLLNALIITISVSIITTIIYPRLVQARTIGDDELYKILIQRGFNLILIIALPFSLGAMVYHEAIVQIVFERGAFDISATAVTGSVYLYYSIGLLFFALNDLFIRTYYSIHDMKSPMIFGGIGVIINIGLDLILVKLMGVNGLAFATSIAACATCVMLYMGLKKKHLQKTVIIDKRVVISVIISAAISVMLSYYIYIFIYNMLWLPRILYLGIAVVVAIGAYLLLLKVFKVEELNLIKKMLLNK